MKLILRNQLTLLNRSNPISKRPTCKIYTAITLAGAVATINYFFQNFVADSENAKQKQLIQRVQNEQSGQNFINSFDYLKADDWLCKRITLDGIIKDGRFLVKRKRGNEQGYIILVPFTVQRNQLLTLGSYYERKFVLNLGWIPKKSKHLVKTLTASDCIGENVYTAENRIQAMKKQQQDNLLRDPVRLAQTTPITTVQVYIRRGEQRDILNGFNNWRESQLYKFIDLPWLNRLFRIPNQSESSTVYLERAAKNEQQEGVAPIPTNKNHVIQDLKDRIEINSKNKDRNIKIGFLGSALAAAFLSI